MPDALRDAAAAAAYYRAALRPIPRTPSCSTAPSCRCWPTATSTRRSSSPIACSHVDKNDRIARLVLGVHGTQAEAISRAARRNLPQSVRGPITDLTATLLVRLGELRRGRHQGRRSPRSTSCTGPDWYAHLQGPACRPDPRSRRQQEGRRQALRAAPTSSTPPRCAWSRPMAAGCRATARQGGAQDLRELRQDAAAPSADRRGDGRSSRRARSCRCSSTTRRPAPPRRCTGSAPRSAAAAARTSASSICSSRSISRPIIRSRCSRSPISTSR